MGLDDYFATATERERPIFESVLEHLRSLGDVHVEPVAVGIFIKRDRSFVELRPMQRWVALSFPRSTKLAHPRISRAVPASAGRWYHVVNVRDGSEIDDELRDLLTDAWFDVAP